MTAHDIEKTVCRRCFAVLDAADRFCRYCGAAIDGVTGSDSSPTHQPSSSPLPANTAELNTGPRPPWGRWMIVLLLFAVLGPLALPMLWRSPQFPRFWKVVLTVLVAVVTVFIVWACWYVLNTTVMGPLRELHEEMEGLGI